MPTNEKYKNMKTDKKESISYGSNKKALLSAISIIELVLEQKTGQDNFIASIIGKPNPSYSDG